MPRTTSSALDAAIRKANIDELLDIIDRLDNESKEIVTKAINDALSQRSKTNALNDIKRLVQIADDDIKGWVVTSVTQAYLEGMNLSDEILRTTGLDIATGELTIEQIRNNQDLLIHKDAINALISDTYLDFGNGINGLVKGAEHQMNEALKRQVRAQMIAGQLTGQSIDEISKEIRELLGDQGFSILIDRGGRQWQLKRYTDMLARTHIIKSGNEGTLNRAVQFNTDIVQVSVHGATDDLCLRFEGKIFSISGNSKNFPRLETIPPFHPNCRHSLLLRPDLS